MKVLKFTVSSALLLLITCTSLQENERSINWNQMARYLAGMEVSALQLRLRVMERQGDV